MGWPKRCTGLCEPDSTLAASTPPRKRSKLGFIAFSRLAGAGCRLARDTFKRCLGIEPRYDEGERGWFFLFAFRRHRVVQQVSAHGFDFLRAFGALQFAEDAEVVAHRRGWHDAGPALPYQ